MSVAGSGWYRWHIPHRYDTVVGRETYDRRAAWVSDVASAVKGVWVKTNVLRTAYVCVGACMCVGHDAMTRSAKSQHARINTRANGDSHRFPGSESAQSHRPERCWKSYPFSYIARSALSHPDERTFGLTRAESTRRNSYDATWTLEACMCW